MLNRSDLPIYLDSKPLPKDFPLQALTYTQQYRSSAALHHHDCLEIGRCLHGNGLMFADGQVHSFGPDSVYVIPAGCVHDSGIIMESPNEPPSVWQYLFVDADRLGCRIEGFAMTERRLLPLFDWMYALACDQPQDWQVEIRLLLKALALEVRRAGTGQEARDSGRMLLVQHKIAAEYAQPLTVERLARECSMSVSAFRKQFTACVGMSPQQYLIQTRLQVAHHLITNTQDKLIDIAEKSGFRTLSSFNRLFRKQYGYAPSALRRRISS